MSADGNSLALSVAADPVGMLGKWFVLKAQIADLQAQERELRATLFAHFFPDAKEGTNSFTLPDGHVLKGKLPYDRKVDPAVVQTLRALRVADLEAGLRDKLGLEATAPEVLVTEALRLNVDALLNWKPELAVKPYRELTAEQQAVFDRCLTIKPGSASMEVAAPPARANAPAAAGFNTP